MSRPQPREHSSDCDAVLLGDQLVKQIRARVGSGATSRPSDLTDPLQILALEAVDHVERRLGIVSKHTQLAYPQLLASALSVYLLH
jgi:hypothetical protein